MKSNPNAGPPGGRGRSEPAPSGDGDRAQLIQVATRCATLDEFVERFAAFAWEGSLVLPAATALPVGTQGKFVVLLRDKTVAMRGRCRVTEAKQTPGSSRNPAVKRIMMRVALLEMDEASRAVHRRLIALRSAPVPLPIPPEPSETTAIEPARQGGATGQSGSTGAAGSRASAPVPAPVSVAPAPPAKAPPAAPPVNLNRTIIGVGIGPDGRAFLAKPAPAPAPAPVPPEISEPTVVNEPTATRSRIPTLPRNETRAPGASYTLPANPLSEFGAQDVDSFIECTLLEADADTGTGIADPPPLADAGGAPAGGGPARRETAYVRARSLISKLPPSLQGRALRVAPYALVAVISIVVGYRMRGTPPAPPAVASRAPAVPARAPAARAPEPEIRPLEAKIETPLQKAGPPRAAPSSSAAGKAGRPQPPARAVADLGSAAAPAEKPVAAPKSAAVAKPAAPEKAAAAEKPAAAEKAAAVEKPAAPEKAAAAEKSPAPQKVALAEKPAAPEKAAVAEKSPAPQKVVAAERPAPDEKPAPAAAAVSGEPGACTARVVTEPKDAKVIWNDQVIGRSPIEDARVPCGPARVTIDRERWQTVTLDVNAQAGNAAVVRERLRRPRGTLIISSSPPGAQITVNRVAAGTAPKEVDVQRFEKVPVKVTLKGHQAWSKTIYLKEAEMKLDAQLVPRK